MASIRGLHRQLPLQHLSALASSRAYSRIFFLLLCQRKRSWEPSANRSLQQRCMLPVLRMLTCQAHCDWEAYFGISPGISHCCSNDCYSQSIIVRFGLHASSSQQAVTTEASCIQERRDRCACQHAPICFEVPSKQLAKHDECKSRTSHERIWRERC